MTAAEPTLEFLLMDIVKRLFDEIGIGSGNLNNETPLYGTRNGISSLSLVRLIVDLEEAVEIHLLKTITIADEKVLSMSNSPFKNVGTLHDYLEGLIAN